MALDFANMFSKDLRMCLSLRPEDRISYLYSHGWKSVANWPEEWINAIQNGIIPVVELTKEEIK